jgi:alginate O-acetyltransferase complex protein AlgJ
MLALPANQTLFSPQTVTIGRIEDLAGQPWRPREDADVLLLGDSFTNIFTAAAMGWGSAAGLAPQLAAALGRDVDVIAQNDAGAHTTRQLLARELAAGRDRLAGKKVVIWQFADRELAVGDWRPVSWPEPGPAERRRTSFFVPPAGPIVVTAVVAGASPVPRPGEVPYKDHIRALHLQDLPDGKQALAYVYSMRDHAWTAAARLQPGARVNVRLRPWAAVAAELEAVNRSELSDQALLDAEPAWAELE